MIQPMKTMIQPMKTMIQPVYTMVQPVMTMIQSSLIMVLSFRKYIMINGSVRSNDKCRQALGKDDLI